MTTPAEALPANAPSPRYRAGWPDHLADLVDRFPGPAWCYYLAATAILFAIGTLLAQRDFAEGASSRAAVRYYALFTGLVGYLFILKHYLRSYARVALEGFRPVYEDEDRVSGEMLSIADARFQLTNTPALPALFASIIGMGLLVTLSVLGVTPFQRLGVAPSPVSFVYNMMLELSAWAMIGAGVYSLTWTLRLVSRFYTRHARVSLFELQPLYAFSALTLRYALGIIVGPSIFLASLPGLLASWSTATLAVAAAAGAFLLFAGPLAGAHRLLAAEQSALLADNAGRLRQALERLHTVADGREDENAASVQHVLLGLHQERTLLHAIGTWPWPPGLLRAFLTALLLPMVIWLIQFVLARLLAA